MPAFYCLHLRTEVRADRVVIRYHPVRRRTIRFRDITDCESRSYQAIPEFGGWGVRGKRADRAYTFRGDQGVQLTLSNGKRVLIGSERPDDLAAAIQTGIKGSNAPN